jgi:hypothetical protein
MSISDVPEGLPIGMFNILRDLKEAVEKLTGEHVTNDKAITYDDAIEIGLIDKNFDKVP